MANVRLFLTSEAITQATAPDFTQLVGKKPEAIRFTLIENAADVEDGEKAWLQNSRRAFQALKMQITIVDLRQYLDKPLALRAVLANSDVIWLGGGNTFYLMWILQASGAAGIITELAHSGVVYGGSSAGALAAGPTIRYIEAADHPDSAPKQLEDGLGLTATVVVPHWGNEYYGPIMVGIEAKLRAAGYDTVHITDAQAVVINGAEPLRIIP